MAEIRQRIRLPSGIHVSAVKRSENNDSWIVRVFNPFDKTIHARVRLNLGRAGAPAAQSPVERQAADYALPPQPTAPWSKVRLVTLEELPEKDLNIDARGFSDFDLPPKKIMTIEFKP